MVHLLFMCSLFDWQLILIQIVNESLIMLTLDLIRIIDKASTNVDESNDENLATLNVGLVVGVLCGITILLLIIITLTWVIYTKGTGI